MFSFKIIPDDPAHEQFEVTAGMRDLRMWEKTHHKRTLGQVSDASAVSATILWEIAYSACVRQRKIPLGMTEDQFVEAYEMETEDDETKAADQAARVGPTPPVA